MKYSPIYSAYLFSMLSYKFWLIHFLLEINFNKQKKIISVFKNYEIKETNLVIFS